MQISKSDLQAAHEQPVILGFKLICTASNLRRLDEIKRHRERQIKHLKIFEEIHAADFRKN